MYATLTNRYTAKSTTVLLKKSSGNILYITKRQYNSAIDRISTGENTPISTDTNFLVYDNQGDAYAYLETLNDDEENELVDDAAFAHLNA